MRVYTLMTLFVMVLCTLYVITATPTPLDVPGDFKYHYNPFSTYSHQYGSTLTLPNDFITNYGKVWTLTTIFTPTEMAQHIRFSSARGHTLEITFFSAEDSTVYSHDIENPTAPIEITIPDETVIENPTKITIDLHYSTDFIPDEFTFHAQFQLSEDEAPIVTPTFSNYAAKKYATTIEFTSLPITVATPELHEITFTLNNILSDIKAPFGLTANHLRQFEKTLWVLPSQEMQLDDGDDDDDDDEQDEEPIYCSYRLNDEPSAPIQVDFSNDGDFLEFLVKPEYLFFAGTTVRFTCKSVYADYSVFPLDADQHWSISYDPWALERDDNLAQSWKRPPFVAKQWNEGDVVTTPFSTYLEKITYTIPSVPVYSIEGLTATVMVFFEGVDPHTDNLAPIKHTWTLVSTLQDGKTIQTTGTFHYSIDDSGYITFPVTFPYDATSDNASIKLILDLWADETDPVISITAALQIQTGTFDYYQFAHRYDFSRAPTPWDSFDVEIAPVPIDKYDDDVADASYIPNVRYFTLQIAGPENSFAGRYTLTTNTTTSRPHVAMGPFSAGSLEPRCVAKPKDALEIAVPTTYEAVTGTLTFDFTSNPTPAGKDLDITCENYGLIFEYHLDQTIAIIFQQDIIDMVTAAIGSDVVGPVNDGPGPEPDPDVIPYPFDVQIPLLSQYQAQTQVIIASWPPFSEYGSEYNITLSWKGLRSRHNTSPNDILRPPHYITVFSYDGPDTGTTEHIAGKPARLEVPYTSLHANITFPTTPNAPKSFKLKIDLATLEIDPQCTLTLEAYSQKTGKTFIFSPDVKTTFEYSPQITTTPIQMTFKDNFFKNKIEYNPFEININKTAIALSDFRLTANSTLIGIEHVSIFKRTPNHKLGSKLCYIPQFDQAEISVKEDFYGQTLLFDLSTISQLQKPDQTFTIACPGFSINTQFRHVSYQFEEKGKAISTWVQPPMPYHKPSGGNGKIIALIFVLLIIFGAGAGYFYYRKRNQGNNNNSDVVYIN